MMRILLSLLLVLSSFTIFGQTTTGSISGTVTDETGNVLPGAQVTVLHDPTGSIYRVVTRENGDFNVANLQVGGPYKITISMSGLGDFIEENVYIGLGTDYQLDAKLEPKSQDLKSALVVGAYSPYNDKHQGLETNINITKINALPTAGRNLQDFLRTVPQAKLDDNGGISIAGQNNRYNQIMIDGAVNNDVFGLSASGTNGGQSGFSPISIDAIEQFQVNVSPYDVSIGNFTGGAVNAVTRRGRNTTEGSVYYFLKNQTLSGKTPIFPGDENLDRKQFSPFATQTYGARVGGAIKENKVFYFLNLEQINENTPQPFDINNYNGNMSQADLNNLVNFVKNNYNYDMGSYDNNIRNNKSTRLVTRLDFNLNENNKLALSYRYTNSNSVNLAPSNSNTINFSNSGYQFPSTTNSFTLEWTKNTASGNFNKLQAGFTNVKDDRGALGSPFPYVSIQDGPASIRFGTEQYSTGNLLKQNNLFLYDKYNFYKGKNAFYAGIDLEYGQTYNLFIRQSYGSYQYNNVNDFLNNDTIARYDRSYSIIPGDISYDGSNAAAEFNTLRIGGFFGDDIKFSDQFTLTAGIRFDAFNFLTTQRSESFFNNTALPVYSQYYNLEGASLGGTPNSIYNFSPRVGFNYKVKEGLQLRGGTGVFVGRIPLVWPGAIYQYTGNQIGSVTAYDTGIGFDPDYKNQYTQADFGGTDAIPSGEVDLLSPKFKLPKVLKTSIGADFKLPFGINASAEFVFTQNLTEIKYINFGLDTATTTLPTVGGIVRYTGGRIPDLDPNTPGNQNPYGNNRMMLVTNRDGNKGSSWNFTYSMNKNFTRYISAGLNYTYGRSKVYMDGTSSQNSSQWRYMESATGRNNLQKSFSDFDMGNRLNVFASFKIPEKEIHSTNISFFLNAQDGNRFSYTYYGYLTNDNASNTVDLIYVPKNASDINLVDYTSRGQTITASEQWTNLNEFINNDPYLSANRGKIVERNGSRLPGSTVLDLKLMQEFTIARGNKYDHKIQFSLDVFNFTNMLNKNWGQVYYVSNDSYQLINFEKMDANGNPEFTFRKNPGTRFYSISDNSSFNPSRWIGQFGVRYLF